MAFLTAPRSIGVFEKQALVGSTENQELRQVPLLASSTYASSLRLQSTAGTDRFVHVMRGTDHEKSVLVFSID